MGGIKQHPSPNFSSRNGATISMLVLHYTGMKTAEEAIGRLCNQQAQVSAHYVADEDGTVYQLVEEADCAWHAGVSYWRGQKNVNNISIGIEIVNPGHEFGYRPFPEMQMQAVAELAQDIIRRYRIAVRNVVGHSDIAPLRKADPGELFDWGFVMQSAKGTAEKRKEIPIPMEKLNLYGYEIPAAPSDWHKIATAFQRHFRQKDISGIWDTECEEILAGLLEIR